MIVELKKNSDQNWVVIVRLFLKRAVLNGQLVYY